MKRLNKEELDQYIIPAKQTGEWMQRILIMARESLVLRDGILKIQNCHCCICGVCSNAGYDAITAADALWKESQA